MSKKKSKPLRLVGMTADGRMVVGGLFAMHDTHGIPLTVSVALCQEMGHVPGFYDFVCMALKSTWSPHRIRRVVEEAASDNGLDVAAVLGRVDSVLRVGVP